MASYAGGAFPLYTSALGFGAGTVNREDFEDVMIRLSPTETPFYSVTPKMPIAHTTHEWLESALIAPSGAGVAEGLAFAAGNYSAGARTRKEATTQIFRKDIEVTNTQRAVRPAGIDDDYAHEIEGALLEIARNIEKRIFSNVSSVATGDRRMKALPDILNPGGAGTSTLALNGSAAAYSAASGANRATLETLLENLFTEGGKPDRLYMYPYHKTVYSRELQGAMTFWGSGSDAAKQLETRNIDSQMDLINSNVDVFRYNFGRIQLVPDRFMPKHAASATAASVVIAAGSDRAVSAENVTTMSGNVGRIWAIETPKTAIGVLRPIQHYPLPPGGDSTRGMVLGELALIVKGAGTAHGQIFNAPNATGPNS